VELRLPDGSPATAAVLETIKTMLRRGFIFLPEGEQSNVIGLTPPLTITKKQLETAVQELGRSLNRG